MIPKIPTSCYIFIHKPQYVVFNDIKIANNKHSVNGSANNFKITQQFQRLDDISILKLSFISNYI